MEKNFSTGALFVAHQLEADASKFGGVLVTLGGMTIKAVGQGSVFRASWWLDGKPVAMLDVLEALDSLTLKDAEATD